MKNAAMQAVKQGFGRWFPGSGAALLFLLPLIVCAVVAARSSVGIYQLELKLTADHPVVVQVSFDSGAGFTDENSAQVFVPASDAPLAVRCPVPVASIQAVRFSPVGGPVVLGIEAVSIRTRFKIPAQARTYRRFDPGEFQTEPPPGEAAPGAGTILRLEAKEGEPAPVCTITPAAPVRLRTPWFFVGQSWLEFAFGWFALWVVLSEAARWLGARGYPLHGPGAVWRRLSPAQAVWLVAAASVVLSTYPVIFLGKSFLGVDYVDGPRLLYDDPSTLPGTHNQRIDANQGSDIFAMVNAIAPYAQVQHRAIFRDGELPLWDRYDEGGLALLGQGQSMFGDPLHLLVIAANGRAWAWDVKFLLAKWLFAAGVGLLVLAATDFLPVSLLLTFSAAFIGFFTFRLNHPAFFSVCYSPWILFAWMRIVRAPTWRGAMRWAGGLIAANWMEMNSGTAKEAYMLLAGLNGTGVLLLLLDRMPLAAKLRRIGGLLVAGVLFCLLASPVLLAFFDTLTKSGSSYDNPVVFQLQPGLFLGLFDEMFYREFNGGEGVLGPSLNGCVLVGILLAAGGGRRLLGDRRFVAVALGSLPGFALVFGVVPSSLIRHLPFLRNIYHVDNTFSCVLLVQCFVLAGLGLKDGLTSPGCAWRRDVLVSLAAGGLLLGAYFGSIHAEQRTNVVFQPTPPITFSPFFCWYAPTFALGVAVLPFALRRLRERGPGSVAVALAVGSLALLHWRMGVQTRNPFSAYTPTLADRVDLLARSDTVDRLHADQSGPFRVFGSGNVFGPGYGAMVDVETVIGLDALWNPYIGALNESAAATAGEGFFEPSHPENRRAQKPFHDLLGVRYYLTMPGDPPLDLPGVSLADHLDLNVYRNDHAWPRAFYVDRLGIYHGVGDFAARVVSGDGQPVAEIDADELAATPGLADRFSTDHTGRTIVPGTNYRLTNHRTFFEVTAPAAGVIVLMEPFVDGDIVAEIDGRPVPVWRVNHAFRGMAVDRPGTYRVMVAYVPKGFAWSLWAAGLGVVLTGAAGWWLWKAEKAPNSKFQAPKKNQDSSTKFQTD